VIFVNENDMSKLVTRAVEDPRTLNRILYVRPPGNTCSFSHLVTLWEKTGKSLDKYHMPQEELVKRIRESSFPLNFQLAMVAAGGCDKTINASAGVEATKLYPDVKFITIDDYLDSLVKTTTNTAAAY
jgi:phenylcoumaran benzylic ether reductase